MAVSRTAELSSARRDGAPPCMPDTSMLGSSGPSLVTVDLFANRSDPPNPPDLSDRRGSRLLGPTSPTQQSAPEGDDSTLMTPSDDEDGQGGLSEPEADLQIADGGGGGDNEEGADADAVSDGVDENDAQTPLSRLNKGKTPETASSLSAPIQQAAPSASAEEETTHDGPQVQIHQGGATGDESSGTPVNLTDTTNHDEETSEGSRRSSRAAQPESPDSQDSQDSSYSSSLFEEPGDQAAATAAPALVVGEAEAAASSWKQKEKQKADPAEAETGSLSEASEGEQTFRPLDIGDHGWEKSAGRPPAKLPIRFRDAVGRNFLFPWEKAKTWEGMRRLVNSCFLHVDVLGPHVQADRYDLSVNLPYPMDAANEILSPGFPLAPVPQGSSSSTTSPATETPSSSNNIASSSSSSSALAGPSNSNSNSDSNSPSQQQQPRSSFVILPELWDDTVEPGMLVVQHMWPFQTPNYIAQPMQPSPPNQPPQPHQHHHHNHNHNHLTGPPPPPAGMHHHHHHHHPMPVGSGRGRGARGRGRGTFAGRGHGGNMGVPALPLPPTNYRLPQIINVSLPSTRGKTMKRQDR